MNPTTTTQISHAINNYYDRNLLEAARPLLVHTNWAQLRDIPRNNTSTVKFRKYSLLSAATTALTEGVTPQGSQLSITDITAVALQYGDFVTLTDVLQFTTPDPVLTEAGKILGQQAANTLDQLTRAVLIAGTTIQYASSATATNQITAAMKLNATEIKEAVRTLQNNNAMKVTEMVSPDPGFDTTPVNAGFVAVISPYTLYDLKNDSNFLPVEKYASKANLMPGEVGAMDDVRFVMSTNAYVNSGAGSGSVDVHYTLVLAKNAYGITRISGEAMRNIIKPLGSAGTADPLEQRSTSGWKATFVAKILDNTFMVVIRHGVTA